MPDATPGEVSDIGLAGSLARAARDLPDHLAVIDGGRRLTWAEMIERVSRLAGAMAALGLKSGGRVVLLALNSHRSLESFYAACWAGGVIVPLNHRLSLTDLATQVTDCAPDIVIIGAEFASLADVLAAAAGPTAAFLIDAGAAYEDAIHRGAPMADAGRRGDDLASIFYTSGTTSAAKGVMLSHGNIMANNLNTIDGIGLGPGSIHLHHGPLFHIGSAARLFSVTHAGGTHVTLPRFEPAAVLAEIERSRVTHATFVPTMFRALLDEPALRATDLRSLEVVSYGSAPMPESLLAEMMAALPHARFVQSYGMTELSPVVTMLGWRDHLAEARHGIRRSAGRAVALAEVAIVDPTGDPLPPGQVGEIVARGPNVMLGYWGRPDLTAQVLRDGWMHTGDVGYLDDDGYLFVVDRLKDMIITGGENVFSQEVENALSAHPAISQCAVLGLPHAYWGEEVHAVIVLKPGASADEAEISAFCRSRLAHYKCPRSMTFRDRPMPLSGANKILKDALRAELIDQGAPGGR